jgi:uncharacterized protein YecT (DUF1311 family)
MHFPFAVFSESVDNGSDLSMHKSKFFLLRPLLSLSVVLALVPSTLAQSSLSDPGAKRMCAAVKDVQIPAADQPTADEKNSLANCSSEDLYFGLGEPSDPVKARKCAYVEMEQGKDDLDMAGRAILMMVYANGRGADRNLDVAMKFACEINSMPGDKAGTIYELERLRKYPPTVRFSVCDHSAAPHLYKTCAILGDRFDQIEREKKIAAITASWSKKEKKAFDHLRNAAEQFFKSRASSEIDLRPTFEVQERAFMERGFIEKLEKLQKGELPAFSSADFKKAQADVDQAYAETQKDPNRRWGTATAQGVRQTQQLWLAYRDAWVKFGKIKYRNVSADSWRTWITQERLAMLRHLLS